MIGIVRSLITRSLRLTDTEFWNQELDKLTRICLSSGYPREFREKNAVVIEGRFELGFYENQFKNQDDNQKWICLPSSELSQQLRPSLRK
ncbi:unnamed protein product [Protopolystoma xenopodis]|uniref:Helix-turn-helix domain-containing protein n=1 Tax=Protopolystoma xenopodis TaxID=117903 RepID=A0A448XMY2_9PLAT|nr:unnamed protein product [Protopolystoma xenopodis]